MPKLTWSVPLTLFLLLGAARSRAVEIIPLAEVKPGMKGYGLTVLQGTEVARFEVEVIDVIKNYRPQQDMILVRCSGQGLERTRIIAGMSGSPVFLDNRLAGAIAYGWQFSLDPIAGVTPIQSMLKELDRPEEPAGTVPMDAGGQGLTPIATPLLVSGLDAPALKALEDELKPYGWVPVMGGAGDRGAGPGKLEVGGAVGAQLVSGDIHMTAVGTVTYLEGNTVLAFGHPFLNGGSLSLPLTTARIHTVLVSQAISMKLASPGPAVGRLTQDRQACIAGRLGEVAPMIPYTIQIKGPGAGVSREYKVAVAQHPMLTPMLLQIVFQQALQSGAAISQPHTINFQATMDFEGRPPIVYQDTLYSLRESSYGQMLAPVRMLLMNPFEKTRLRSMQVELEVHEQLEAAEIKALRAYPLEVEPGQTVTVRVTLKPYRAPEEEVALAVRVPEEARDRFTIEITGGSQMSPDVAEPESVEDLVQAIGKLYPARALVASYSLPGRGVDLRGQRYRRLPPSVVSVLTPASATEARTVSETRTLVQKVPYVVLGADQIEIKVRNPLTK